MNSEVSALNCSYSVSFSVNSAALARPCSVSSEVGIRRESVSFSVVRNVLQKFSVGQVGIESASVARGAGHRSVFALSGDPPRSSMRCRLG